MTGDPVRPAPAFWLVTGRTQTKQRILLEYARIILIVCVHAFMFERGGERERRRIILTFADAAVAADTYYGKKKQNRSSGFSLKIILYQNVPDEQQNVVTELSATGRTLSASAALSLLMELRIFLRCKRCSTPKLLLRSSSFKSYRKAPSTAAAINASWY